MITADDTNKPDGDTPFLVLGAQKLKRALGSDWKAIAQTKPAVDVSVNKQFLQELRQPAVDTQWLSTTIRETEAAYDADSLPKQRINLIRRKLDKIAANYAESDPIAYRILELDALLEMTAGHEELAKERLGAALRVMNHHDAFISTAARNWMDGKRGQIASAYAEAQNKERRRQRKKIKRVSIGLAIGVGVFVVLGILSGPVADYFTIAHADPAMLKLAHESGMTREGELLFLRTNPQLVSDTQMAQDCPSLAENTNSTGFILQGCYIPNQDNPSTGRIYLRQMASDLYDLEIVTAAYEMLHAAYYNIENNSTLNGSIDSNYSSISDPTTSNLVNEFAKTEPGERDLELFSILGTQDYDNLDNTLQHYYAPYLSNPDTVVNDNSQVANTFQNDEDQLQQLQNTINTDTNDANTAYADSVSWANAGNQYEDDYNYNIYTQDIDNANSAVNQYNTLLQSYDTLVAEYNGQQFTPIQSVQTQTN